MKFPPVGLGTMEIDDPQIIETALDAGYRHLDTAQIYNNERVVGAALAASDVAPDDCTVATKLWADSLGGDAVHASATRSAKRLGVDVIDLLYVHRPIDTYEPHETLAAFDGLHAQGRINAVGVSNFTLDELATARSVLDAPIAAHQVEFHPLFWSPALLEDARVHDTTLVAYSPLAGGRVRDLDTLVEIARAHETTPEAVAIAWLTAKPHVVTIPKASRRRHQEANLAAADLTLSTDECRRIDGIDRTVELYPE